MPCGSLHVDWGGAAFKSGVHEASGELDLIKPVTLHLSMPAGVRVEAQEQELWKQEQLVAGVSQERATRIRGPSRQNRSTCVPLASGPRMKKSMVVITARPVATHRKAGIDHDPLGARSRHGARCHMACQCHHPCS